MVIDPKETNNIAGDGYLWLLSPLLSEVLPFMYSLEEYGLIEPGADERTEGTVTIPFLSRAWSMHH